MPGMAAETASGVDEHDAAMKASTRPNLPVLVAISVIATVITSVVHEGVGHGGMCIVTGGTPLVLSTVHFECSAEPRLVAAGGTIANLIFGALFWGGIRIARQSARWRYFFWLLMIFNLFDAGGYFLFSGIGDIGDWAEVIAGWQPVLLWRACLTLLGVVTYFFVFVPLCLRALRPFVGRDAKQRVERARLLTLTPYFTCGILACVAGALNPVGAILILISAAAASFGGKSGMAWMWVLLRNPKIPNSELQMPEIESSPGWIVAAVILALGFIAGLGPGLKLH